MSGAAGPGPRARVVGFDDLGARAAYDLWRLRQDVFVVEQGSPYPDLDGRDVEPSTRHLLLEEDGVLVGCARVLDDGGGARVGRLVVARAARGRGLAAVLLDASLAVVGDREVRLDAQTQLAGWYARWGFAVSGPEFVEDGVAHVPMARPAGASYAV
jgi:ElaA protein